MSYNRKAIADALSKMNKAKKPKQPKDIIKDPEGQYKYPGVPTRVASDNITMQGVSYPVLGVDNLGNQQMMYPGAEYVFPGADYVDEFPMMQTGGQRPVLYVDPNDPAGRARYQAYKDSLGLYNYSNKLLSEHLPMYRYPFSENPVLGEDYNIPYNPTGTDTGFDGSIYKIGMTPDDFMSGGFDYRKLVEQSLKTKNKPLGWTFSDVSIPVYLKPVERVKYRDPKVVAKQQQLIDAGYDIGGADGIWGDKSKAAWEEFQAQQTATPEPEVVEATPEQGQQVLTPVTETRQSTTLVAQQQPTATQPPSGYNYWTDHMGQPLDPNIYGWAPSTNPRQIDQNAETYALKRANEAYQKLGATPWATEGNRLVVDMSKPYFSKTAATNALPQLAEQLGVPVDQLRIEKAPAGYSGYVVIQNLPQQKYGGLVTGLTNTSGNLLMSEQGKRMMAQSGSLSATNKMFLGNPMVTKRKKSVFVPGAPFQEGGNTSDPGMDAMMKARFAYAHMHGNPAAQRMTYPVDNPYIFTGTEPYTNPDMAGEFGTHYMFSQDNYAVPTIQQDEYGNLIYNPEANYTNPEAIQFDRPEDAEYFAEYYKQIAPGMQTGGSTDWKSRIASAMNFQKGGQLSKEEFEKRKAAYKKLTGRDFEPPKSFKPSEKARQQYQEKYNQQPTVQQQPSETTQQSRGVDTRREKEIVEAQANTDAKAAENYMHFYNKTYGSDYGAISYEQALQKVRLPDFDKTKFLNMYNLGQPKNEQLQSFREEDQANRTWEVITNPFTAFEYAVATGDMANMPSNINAARMQGYDIGVTPGRNMVGNALNMTTNLFDAGDKVIRNVGEGNYLGAGLEAMRFLPGSRLKVGVNKTAKKIEPAIIKNSYDPTPRQNKKIIDYSEKPILPKDREPYIGRKILKADKDQQIFESFLSGDILDKYRNSRIINYTQEEAQALEALEKAKQASFLNPLKAVDNILPMLNPFGFISDGMTPFFLSPLQQLSFYGKKLKGDNMAFRKFGNDLSHVQKTKTLDPSAGGWRIGKSQIKKEGNWAALRETNERYPGLFEATFDFNNPNTQLSYHVIPNRDGVLIVNKNGTIAPTVDLKDPGVSLNRRLPFSSRYVPINKEKLLNNQFQLATQLPHIQSIVEKYGIGVGWAALGAVMAGDSQVLTDYLDIPKHLLKKAEQEIKSQYNKLSKTFQKGGSIQPLDYFDGELTDQEIEQYKKGGCVVVKL